MGEGKGKKSEKILEEVLWVVLGGLLGYIEAKVLVMSASSGACS